MVNRTTFTDTIRIGQRVFCSLPHAGLGTVVEIHGEQSPASCQSMAGGIGVMGGSAHFDVVWDNGNYSKKASESLMRSSVQWDVLDEVVSAEVVEQAIEKAEATRREKEEAKARQARAHEAAKAELANDPQLRTLKRADECDDTPDKLASANLRKLLKIHFPRVKFSVRKDGSNAIYVRWQDGPTAGEVDAQAQRFKRGNFNGMTDSYEHCRSPWVDVFGGVEYVFTRREQSDELIAAAIDAVWEQFAPNVRELEKPTPEDFRSGRFTLINVPGLNESVAHLIRQQAAITAT